MGVKTFDVLDLGKARLIDPEKIGYKDSIGMIQDELFKTQKSFVKIGWYLKHIRDNELYKEDGYANIWECAADQLGLSQSTASRFMKICERFSENHNSPELDKKYAGFDKSQMIEMLPMSEEQIDQITPDMSVKEIRGKKTQEKTVKEKKSKSDNDVLVDNLLPGQTSIEKDFSEYMPQNTEETYEPTYEENNVRQDTVIDGDFTEIDFETLDNVIDLINQSDAEENSSQDGSMENKVEDKNNIPKKCITGWSKYGICSCCGANGVTCCNQCEEDCNSRCGWIDEPNFKDNLSIVKYVLEKEKKTLKEYSDSEFFKELPTMTVMRQKIIVAALESMVCDLENFEPVKEQQAKDRGLNKR